MVAAAAAAAVVVAQRLVVEVDLLVSLVRVAEGWV